MKNWKRAVAVATLVTLCASFGPAPVAAESTQEEIAQGQAAAREVDAQSLIMTDPVLNEWVDRTEANLAQFRARRDINYQVKIIDTNDVNAFSLPGGFVYVYFGALNFVNSDDELAGVLGHETGHTERRNQVTLQAKAEILNLILGIASIFNPFVYQYGNLVGGAAIEKMSRIDELQADQYGLLLMSRAGYDPNAMVSFQYRLGKEFGEEAKGVEKYFEDHPDSPDRVAHLLGYPELSLTNYDQILAQAIHDESEGRYAYALMKYDTVLKAQPDNQLALLHKGQVELALGSLDQSQLALKQVLHAGTTGSPAQAAAQQYLALMPETNTAPGSNMLHPDMGSLRGDVEGAIGQAKTDQTAMDARVKLGKDDLHRLNDRLNNLAYEVPNLSNVDIAPGSRIEGVVFDIYHMTRDLDAIFDKASNTIDEGDGIAKDDMGVLNQMDAPLRASTIGGDSLRLLPYYKDIDGQIRTSTGELVTAVTAARGAMALCWQAVPAMDQYFRKLDQMNLGFGGDLAPRDAQELKPLAAAAQSQLDAAEQAAEEAQTLYFAAQAREIEARITLLGLAYPEGRYDSLIQSIHTRLDLDPPTYDEALRLGISPGDVATASWLAAEEKVPVSTVINEQRSTGTPFVDMGLNGHYSMESLEVVLGMIFEGYAENPADSIPVAVVPIPAPSETP
jgi:predicted Zn-dependent protease